MAITAAMVKELRETTGAGMMDCKKALTATDGDMDAAINFLREKGLATAAKKAGRVAAEGTVAMKVSEDGKKAVAVEINIETDFAAKTDKFADYVALVADQALNTTAADITAFLAEPWAADTSKTVEENLKETIGSIGENMSIRRFKQVSQDAGIIATYSHAGGKIGAIVSVETDVVNDEIVAMAKNICMQVAAMKPEFISEADISAEHIANEREVIVSQSLNAPDTLPRPILNGLLEKAVSEKIWSDEDIAAFEEHKSNMNFVWNFLSDAAKPALVQLAMADKENIIANKMFNGAVEGRLNKGLKEVCLMNQTYVKAEDGKQAVKAYIDSVAKAQGATIAIKEIVRFECGEGIEKKEENFAEEVAKQMGN